ncbi:MAG: hypothetical protein ACFFCS_04205 [Candidatus Hodarchaeota archaeon]
MSAQNFHIAFDESQKPRGRLEENYTALRRTLEAEGFGCWKYSSFPITRESLQNYDILVFACTDFSKFTTEEIGQIAIWVKEDGGGLLLMNHAGGDKGRRTNMSELASQFAMIFENDQVSDDYHNYGINNMPEVKNFPTPHPIVEGITSICYRAGCSISIVGFAEAVAQADFQANPASATAIAATEVENGRAVCIGSYEIFRDEIAGGINQMGHAQLARNLFNWLVTDKRRALRQGGLAIQPSAAGASAGNPNPDSQDYDAKLVPIGSVGDLFTEVRNIMNEVNLIKARLENILRVAAILEAAEQEEPPVSEEPITPGAVPTTSEPEPAAAVPTKTDPKDLMSLIQAAKKGETTASPPPSSGGSMGDIMSELKAEQKEKGLDGEEEPAEEEVNMDAIRFGDAYEEPKPEKPKEIKYEVTAADKRKSKDDLDDEIEKLEAKLKSVENLKDFTERKHKDGKIDDERYEKDITKFDKDIKMTESKIKVYKELMEGK